MRHSFAILEHVPHVQVEVVQGNLSNVDRTRRDVRCMRNW